MCLGLYLRVCECASVCLTQMSDCECYFVCHPVTRKTDKHHHRCHIYTLARRRLPLTNLSIVCPGRATCRWTLAIQLKRGKRAIVEQTLMLKSHLTRVKFLFLLCVSVIFFLCVCVRVTCNSYSKWQLWANGDTGQSTHSWKNLKVIEAIVVTASSSPKYNSTNGRAKRASNSNCHEHSSTYVYK